MPSLSDSEHFDNSHKANKKRVPPRFELRSEGSESGALTIRPYILLRFARVVSQWSANSLGSACVSSNSFLQILDILIIFPFRWIMTMFRQRILSDQQKHGETGSVPQWLNNMAGFTMESAENLPQQHWGNCKDHKDLTIMSYFQPLD